MSHGTILFNAVVPFALLLLLNGRHFLGGTIRCLSDLLTVALAPSGPTSLSTTERGIIKGCRMR